MSTSPTVEEIARQFAQAVDTEDYEAAAKLVAGAVVYSYRGKRLIGRDKILDSFARSDEWTRDTFDHVYHDHSTQPVSETVVRVLYVDAVACGDKRLDYRSAQVLEVDEQRGVITHITHIDLPGETQKLEHFMMSCGLD